MDCELIGWCALTASEQAAWVQAVGSIAAILVAVYVPWKQRKDVLRDEKKKDMARVKVMAAALVPPLEDTRAALTTILKWLDKDFAARQTMTQSLLPRHPEFDQFRPDLHLLGDIAILVNSAISQQQFFLDAVEALRTEEEPPKALKDKILREATLAIAVITSARDKLAEINQ